MKPLAIDLFCGLGGWTEGLLAEGYYVVGFDVERHHYGDAKYPAQLVLQDVLTLHGRQFKDAALIVASPPCQEFSYMAMPWSLAKVKRAAILADPAERKRLTALFDACFRIQREAIEAAGHFIPLVVENVRGANEWVGRARWNFGSFYLWGDVPALMPIVKQHNFKSNTGTHERTNGPGRPRFITEETVKGVGIGSVSWGQGKGQRHPNDPRNFWSQSSARKAASAAIAKIPFALASHIARTWKPQGFAV
jgi:hypothetical protein